MAKYNVSFKEQALDDIDYISEYLSNFNPYSKAKFYDALEKSIALLEQFPKAGFKRDIIQHDVRLLNIEWHYFAIYRVIDLDIEIIKICSSKQEYTQLFI